MTAPHVIVAIGPDELRRIIREEVTAAIAGQAPDEWLTRAQMARALGVSPQTVTRMVARGEIEARGMARAAQYRRKL